jgi:retinitis pigmentosa 9 protein
MNQMNECDSKSQMEYNKDNTFSIDDEDLVNSQISRRPEDAIPDLPENQAARDFLKLAPTHGLYMPLGKEVKVMQCWRCKAYGHRTGDRECPLRLAGNLDIDKERRAREDPMLQYVVEEEDMEFLEKYRRIKLLKQLLEEVREEEQARKARKRLRKAKKKEKKEERKRSKKIKNKHVSERNSVNNTNL